MNWRPHTEKPEKLPTTALIVVRDDHGELLLLVGVYMALKQTNGEFVNEIDGNPVNYPEFWWLAEDELLATVPAPMKVEPPAEEG